jgi:hypothetical protein
MGKTKFLDQSRDSEIARLIEEFLSDEGYSAEESIPGLIAAVVLIAEKTNFPEEALDEAANLLADGPTELEAFV